MGKSRLTTNFYISEQQWANRYVSKKKRTLGGYGKRKARDNQKAGPVINILDNNVKTR